MASDSPNRRGVFAQAATSDSVTAEVRVEDILLMTPGCSAESAKAFLNRHDEEIANAMLRGGLNKVIDIIDRLADDDGKRRR